MNYIDIISIVFVVGIILFGLSLGMKKGARFIYALGASALISTLIVKPVINGMCNYSWFAIFHDNYYIATYIITLVILMIPGYFLSTLVFYALSMFVQDDEMSGVGHIMGMIFGGLAGVSLVLITLVITTKLDFQNEFLTMVRDSFFGKSVMTLANLF